MFSKYLQYAAEILHIRKYYVGACSVEGLPVASSTCAAESAFATDLTFAAGSAFSTGQTLATSLANQMFQILIIYLQVLPIS